MEGRRLRGDRRGCRAGAAARDGRTGARTPDRAADLRRRTPYRRLRRGSRTGPPGQAGFVAGSCRMSTTFKAACVQTNSDRELAVSLKAVGDSVRRACDAGADFIATPENVLVMEARNRAGEGKSG